MIELDLNLLEEALNKHNTYTIQEDVYGLSINIDDEKMNVIMNFQVYNKSFTKTLKSYQTKIHIKGDLLNRKNLLGAMWIDKRIVWDDYLLVIANKFEQVINSLTYN